MNFDQRINRMKSKYRQNRAEILTGVGIGGVIVSSYFLVKGTANAVRKIEARKRELEVEELSFKEKFMLCWRDYIFPFATLGVSLGLIIKSDSIKAKETGELLSAVMVSRSLLNDYKDAVEEVVSEKKKEEIDKKAADNETQRILSDPSIETFYPTGNGNVLFVENLTGTAFRSSRTAVDTGLANAVIRIKDLDYISVNELRYEIDLPGHACGEILGFNRSTGLEYRVYGGEYMGELCWFIDFYTVPITDFDMVYKRI